MNRSQSYCFHGIVIIYVFLFLQPLLNTFASPHTPFKCRLDQRDALLELKEEFQNPATTLSWNKRSDCCFWEGVTCDAKQGNVISLTRIIIYPCDANTSLKSSSGLFKLQHLRSLNLVDCNLHGEIPSSIGNLSHLTQLFLSSNQLVGEIPSSIGNLNQLTNLYLSSSSFSGNIPTSFSNLTKLERLDLHENQFTGGDIVLANLTNLSNIDLSFNNFKSFISADLNGPQKLWSLVVSENSFSGFFPSSLLMIPSLYRIELSRNQFQGPIDFGNTSSHTQLGWFDISYNNFDGLISKSISKLSNLEFLDISHNNFVGRVPRSLSKLVNLSSLDLSYNKLEGEVPHCLWTSSKLESAQLSYNSFNNFGKSVEVVDGASLKDLDLGSNSLQGPFPQWICKLSLETLVFSNNHFNGSIPQCLKSCTSLVKVSLRNNSLSGFLPDLCTNTGAELRSLDVSHNNLKGKLPKSLMNCTSMVLLNVNGNKIKDKFPFWLRELSILALRSNAFYGPVYFSSAYLEFPNLCIIDISHNNFSGSLPQEYFANWQEMSYVGTGDYGPERVYMWDEIHSYADSIEMVYKGVDTDFTHIFKAFKAIDFSGNRFSGHIPGSVGILSGLSLLNLSGNAFTGNIPPSLTNITKLETLDLSRNNLSGKIPPGLGNLSFLSYINFSHNHLQGLVPQSTQFDISNNP